MDRAAGMMGEFHEEYSMSRKITLLVLLATGYTMVLGLNCIPNIGAGLQIPGLNLN